MEALTSKLSIGMSVSTSQSTRRSISMLWPYSCTKRNFKNAAMRLFFDMVNLIVLM